MHPYTRTLQFEIDRSGTVARVQRYGSVPCGAASFVGMKLADAVKPVGVAAGPMYHGVLGGHWPCQYAFTAGRNYDTIDVHMPALGRSRSARGSFATFDRTVEVAERYFGVACATLVAVPSPLQPETQPPGAAELQMAQEFLIDRLEHPLAIVTLAGTVVVAALPCMTKRLLESKFSEYEQDCRTALSDRYSWIADSCFQMPPFDLRQTVDECIARCLRFASSRSDDDKRAA